VSGRSWISVSRWRNHSPSLHESERDWYLASVLERETVACLRYLQDITLSPILNLYPEVEHQLSLSSSQSESCSLSM
jgi:hypothetical protein